MDEWEGKHSTAKKKFIWVKMTSCLDSGVKDPWKMEIPPCGLKDDSWAKVFMFC